MQLDQHAGLSPAGDLPRAHRTGTGATEKACEGLPLVCASTKGLSESCKEELRRLKGASAFAPVALLAECLPAGISAEHALARAGIEFQLQDNKVRAEAMSVGSKLLAASRAAVNLGLMLPGECADQHWLERIARERFRLDPVQGIVPALAEHLELLTRKLIVWRDFNRRAECSNISAPAKLPFKDRWYGKMAREALMRQSPGHLDMSAWDLPYLSTVPPSVADCEKHQKGGGALSLEEQAAIKHAFRLERLSEKALRRLHGTGESENGDKITSRWFKARWGLSCPDESPQDRRVRLRSLLAKYGVDYPTICLDSAATAPVPEDALAGFPSTEETEQETFQSEVEAFNLSGGGAEVVEESGFFVPQPGEKWKMEARPTLYVEEPQVPEVQVYVSSIETDSEANQRVFDILADLSKYFQLFSGFDLIRDLGKRIDTPEEDVQPDVAQLAKEDAPSPEAKDANPERQQVAQGAEIAMAEREAGAPSEAEAMSEPSSLETEPPAPADAPEAGPEEHIEIAAKEEATNGASLHAELELAERGKINPLTEADEVKGGSIEGSLSHGEDPQKVVEGNRIEAPLGMGASGGTLLVGTEEISLELTEDGNMTMAWRPGVRQGDMRGRSSSPVVEVILDRQIGLNAHVDTVRKALEAAAEAGAARQLKDLSVNPFFAAMSKAGKIRRLENAAFGQMGNEAVAVVSLDLAEDAVLEKVHFFGAGTLVRLRGETAVFNRVSLGHLMLDIEISSCQWRDCFATDTTVIRGALGASHFNDKCRMLWDASRADCRLVSFEPSSLPEPMTGLIVDLARFPADIARRLGAKRLSRPDLERIQADQSVRLGKGRLLDLTATLAASIGIASFDQGKGVQARRGTKVEMSGRKTEYLALPLNEMQLPGTRQRREPGGTSEARERAKAFLVIVVDDPESPEPCAIKLCWQEGKVLRPMAKLAQPGLHYQDAAFKLLDICSTGSVALPLAVTPQVKPLGAAKQGDFRQPDRRLARIP